VFSARTMDEASADLLVDAYFRSGKDPRKMAEILQVPSLDLEVLTHPLFRRKVIERAKQLSQRYSLDEHLEKLKEIRDACLEGDKPDYKVALAAEVSLGKAAGLYEKIKEGEDEPTSEPEKLSTREIRRLLIKSGIQVQASLPAPDDPAESEEDLREEDLP